MEKTVDISKVKVRSMYVNTKDWPELVDSCINEAEYEEDGKWRELTEEELDEVNEDADFVYESALEYII